MSLNKTESKTFINQNFNLIFIHKIYINSLISLKKLISLKNLLKIIILIEQVKKIKFNSTISPFSASYNWPLIFICLGKRNHQNLTFYFRKIYGIDLKQIIIVMFS